MSSADTEMFDVIICGGGPTGALLSANLSRLGVVHVLLEREPGITTDPRGIALDEDGIRIMQGAGLYDKLYTDVGKRKIPSVIHVGNSPNPAFPVRLWKHELRILLKRDPS